MVEKVLEKEYNTLFNNRQKLTTTTNTKDTFYK